MTSDGPQPVHGEDGWNLVQYDWDDVTGSALCMYERAVYSLLTGSTIEERTVKRQQPAGPWHAGWTPVVYL